MKAITDTGLNLTALTRGQPPALERRENHLKITLLSRGPNSSTPVVVLTMLPAFTSPMGPAESAHVPSASPDY